MKSHQGRPRLPVAWLLCLLALGTGGVAEAEVAQAADQPAPPATQPDRAGRSLAQILPGLTLPEPKTAAEVELPAQARELLAEAEKLIADKRAVLAVVRLEKALGYIPKSRQIHLALGRAHILGGNAAKAQLHLTRTLAQASDDQQSWYWLAVAQRQLEQTDSALKSLLLANLCAPAKADSPLAVLLPYELGKVLDGKGYSAAALPLLEKVLAATAPGKLSPAQKAEPQLFSLSERGRTALTSDVARLRVAVGRADSAVKLLESLPPRERAKQSARIALLLAYRGQGRTDKAAHLLATLARKVKVENTEAFVTELADAIGSPQALAGLLRKAMPAELTPADAPLALATALALNRSHAGKQARRTLTSLLKAQPDLDASIHVRLLGWQTLAGDWAAAAQALRDAIQAHPADKAVLDSVDGLLAKIKKDKAGQLAASFAEEEDFASLYVAGRLHAAAGDSDAARKCLAGACEKKKGFVAGYVARMRIDAAAGEHDSVLAIREEALKAGVKSAQVRRLAGNAYLAKGQVKEALDDLRRAEQLDRSSVQIALDLADAYIADDQKAGAMRRLRRAYEMAPANPEVLIRLARANANMQQWDEVISYARKAEQIEPKNIEAKRLRGLATVREGLARRQDRSIRQGVRVLRQLVGEHPEDAPSQAALGRALLLTDKPVEAVAPLQKALALNEELTEARRDLADAFAKTRRLDEAIEQYQVLAEKLPNDEEINGRLAGLLIGNDKLEEAAEVLTRLKATRQALAAALVQRAQRQRKYELALTVAARQVEVADDETARLHWQGMQVHLLGRLKRHDEAVRLARKVHEQTPDNQQAAAAHLYALLAAKRYDAALELVSAQIDRQKADSKRRQWQIQRIVVLAAADRDKEAVKAAEDLYEADPTHPELVDVYVATLLSVRRYERVLAVLDAAEKADVPLPQLPALRMRALGRLGRLKEMQKVLTAWLESAANREKPDIWYTAASIYALVNRAKDAREALEKVLDLEATHASANNDLGYQLADQGIDLDRAEKMVQTAVVQSPGQAAYIDSLAWVYYKKGRFEQARRLIEKALAIDPDADPVITDHHGDVLYRLGERDKALAQWKASAEARRKEKDRPVGVEASTLEKTLQKIKAVEQDRSDVPVAPLGEGVTPPGAQRI